MTGALGDLRQGWRGLLRSPWMLISAVLCLALGIGVNATMLGLLDVLLFRPPVAVRDVETVHRLSFRQPEADFLQETFSYPMVGDLASGTDAFSAFAAYQYRESSLGSGAEAQRVRLELVTASFFPLLGVQPARGRLFSPDEGDPERPGLVAMVSWEFWRRVFGGADLLGRNLKIGQQRYTVAGILPRRFTGVDLRPVDVWLPIGAFRFLGADPGWSRDRGTYCWQVVGRLRPGVSVLQATRQATIAHRRAFAVLGDRQVAKRGIALSPVQPGRGQGGEKAVRLTAWCTGAAVAVFLTACANVAGLLFVRSLSRRQEMAVRLALGASRARLALLVLSESLLLAALGGAAACAVARWGETGFTALFLSQGIPRSGIVAGRPLAILGMLMLAAVLLCGAGPALWALRKGSPAPALGGGRDLDRGRSSSRTFLLVGEIAFAFLLLVGAGVFSRSLRNARGLRLGFDADRVLVVTSDLAAAGYSPVRVDAFYRRALERVRALPGVERASVAAAIPFRMSYGGNIFIPGRGDFWSFAPAGGIYMNAVAEDFFSTLGTIVRRGRALTVRDGSGSERVAIVNETLAKAAWPGADPLGRCLREGAEAAPCTTVVGVVEDVRRQQLLEPPTAQVYLPLAQAPAWVGSRALFVRVSDAVRLRRVVAQSVQSLDRDVPFVEVRSLGELLDPQLRDWRVGMAVFSLFGVLALGVAAIGIFATVGHAVASRTAELGVRKALGARFPDLLWVVMRTGLAPAAAGIALGWAAALALGRFIEPLLFEVSPRDPLVISTSALALLAAALVASFLPALRVQAIDPATALRAE